MINIEELESDNRRLRDELLRVKRELMETAAVEQAFKDRDIKDLALRLFAVQILENQGEPYFHAFNRRGYSVKLIAKWDYLDEVLPGYAAGSGRF